MTAIKGAHKASQAALGRAYQLERNHVLPHATNALDGLLYVLLTASIGPHAFANWAGHSAACP